MESLGSSVKTVIARAAETRHAQCRLSQILDRGHSVAGTRAGQCRRSDFTIGKRGFDESLQAQ
jgi:hypothetical protein